MTIASRKDMLIRTLLQSGKNKDMRTYAACVVYRLETQTLEPIVFVVFPRANLKWAESLNAHTVVAEDALDEKKILFINCNISDVLFR